MKNKIFCSFFFGLFVITTYCKSNSPSQPHPEFPSKVHFVENRNQWEEFVKYEADFRGGKLFLESCAFTFLFYHPGDIQSMHAHRGREADKIRLHSLKIHPVDANIDPVVSEFDPASHFNNYFIGNDPSKWATGVRLFSTIVYDNIYPGIDMKFYSSMSDIKYDFIVSPGAEVNDIQLAIDGADKLYLKDGNLEIILSIGDVIKEKPFAYQIINNEKKQVACNFSLSDNRLSFVFPEGYNKSLPLIIDPTLVFSSYTGSTADNWGFTATYDAAGNLYAGGNVFGFGYPVTTGAYQMTFGNGVDMAIAKFNDVGTTLLYATYLGGAAQEQPHSLVIDNADNLIIYGTTYSSNYPVTIGCYDNSINGLGDIVVSKLNSSGNMLLGSTFVGGSADDGFNTDPNSFASVLKYSYSDDARGEVIADINNDYIIGSCTHSSDFPATMGTVQPAFGGGIQDGIIFKINSALTGLVWSTFMGGISLDAVYDCVIANNGELYVAGGTNSTNFTTTTGVLNPAYQGGIADGFLLRLSSDATVLQASTFIGTNNYDQTFFVELDFSGNVYCTGQTEGQYPVSAGVYSNVNGRQFIHKLDPSLSSTIYSTVFGNGSLYPNISPTAFLVDTCENVYVSGWGRCMDFGVYTPSDVSGMPLTPNAFQSTTDGCDFYFFVLTPGAASLNYATYFGGGTSGEHVDGGTSRFDKNGVIYQSVCAGCGGNQDFPTTPGVVSNTNNGGNCNNGVIKLAFNLSKTVSSITTTPSSGCAPFTLSFINSSINGQSYLWDFGDGSPQSNSFAPTHTYVSPGVYQVMLVAFNTNSCNQNDTSYASITVTSSIQTPATFLASQSGSCDTFLVNTVYTANWGDVFHWDFGDGFISTGLNPSHLYTDTGTYEITLIVTDTTCSSNSDTVSHTVHFGITEIDVSIPMNPVNGCSPLSVFFTGVSSSSGTYAWNFMDGSPLDTSLSPHHVFTNTGIYNVMFIATDQSTCNKSDTAFISVNVYSGPPVIPAFNSIIHQDCINPTADFYYSGSGGNFISWDFGDSVSATGMNVSHVYSAPGTYVVTVNVIDTVCGSAGTISNTISFYPPVAADININGLISGCAPQNVSLSNSFNSTGNYFWDLGDSTYSDLPNVDHTYRSPGNFNIRLVVTDSTSCNLVDTAEYVLKVYEKPKADFFYTLEHQYFYTDVEFFNLSSSNSYLYRWDFSDNRIDTTIGPVQHRYTSGGNYNVCLDVVTIDGCEDIKCEEIIIENAETIYIPSSFSPNGDGLNDLFKIYYTGLIELKVMIFNRWGDKIYEYNTLEGGWDGLQDGKPVMTDVYVYKLQATGLVHENIEKTGKVTVVY